MSFTVCKAEAPQPFARLGIERREVTFACQRQPARGRQDAADQRIFRSADKALSAADYRQIGGNAKGK